MIRFSEIVARDFLSPEQCKQLQQLNIDMPDPIYSIWKNDGTYFLTEQNAFEGILKDEGFEFVCNTYSISEMLQKIGYVAGVVFSNNPINNIFNILVKTYEK